jgi:hypothetical protein
MKPTANTNFGSPNPTIKIAQSSFTSQRKLGPQGVKMQIKDRLRMIIDHTTMESIRTVERLVSAFLYVQCVHSSFLPLGEKVEARR